MSNEPTDYSQRKQTIPASPYENTYPYGLPEIKPPPPPRKSRTWVIVAPAVAAATILSSTLTFWITRETILTSYAPREVATKAASPTAGQLTSTISPTPSVTPGEESATPLIFTSGINLYTCYVITTDEMAFSPS